MRILRYVMMCMAVMSSMLSYELQAQDASDLGEPAITIKTNAYATLGEANKFSIIIGTTEPGVYYDIDQGFGLEEFEAGYATLDEEGVWHGPVLYGRVSEKGEIKIYGDPTKIDVFHAIGCYITDIDLSKCVNLDILNLEHNELKSLDLTPNTKLQAIYLSDNQGTEQTPIIIGTPKPDLQILEVDIIDWLDPDFKPDYPRLAALDCYATKCISKLDLSGCPSLVNLVVEMTSIESLDLSVVPNLWHLNISESAIKEIDLSVVPKLAEFLCDHSSGTVNPNVKIKSLDITHNPELYYLAASSNELTELDVTKNPKLKNLYLRKNALKTLDLSQNPELASLDITGNRFTFATLPADRTTLYEYFYAQQPYEVAKSCAVNSELDFTEMLRDGSNTYVRVMTGELGQVESEVETDKYTWADGKLTFNTTLPDSVYVEFGNSELSDYSINTTKFMVKNAEDLGKPSKIVNMMVASKTAAVAFKAGIDGASAEKPATLMVDFGDGDLKEFTVTSDGADTEITGTSSGYYVYIYLPENEILSALNLDGQRLLTLDIKAATELRWLSARNCSLSSLNLVNNRCLAYLNLSDNNFSKLDLTGVSGSYEKNFLKHIEAANNKLTSFTLVNTRGCEYLDLSGNKIAEYSLKDYDNMRHLDMSDNLLQTVNVAYLTAADYIDLSGNELVEIEGVSEADMPALSTFDIRGNNLTLATLPLFVNAPDNYVYAPQSPIVIAQKAPSVALDTQYVTVNGSKTQFTWVKNDGTVLVEGTDYSISNGLTRFLTIDGDPVMCHITHPAFPDFTGDNVLSTTAVIPMGAPTTVIGTFTVDEVSAEATIGFTTTKVSNVYVDWRGDGQDFHAYPTTNAGFTFSADIPAVSGTKAVMYTYDEPSDIAVVSINGISMADFDASPMTNVIMLGLYGTGLEADKITYPAKEKLRELSIDDSEVDNIDLAQFPALENLVISNSKLANIDLSKAPLLKTASLGSNQIVSVKFDNQQLWGVDLSSNNLSDIDVSGLPNLEQLLISNNNLSEIDLSPVASKLQALVVVGNRFTFASLPRKADFPRMEDAFYYGNQANVDVAVVDDKVDLSAQARVGDTETVFTWYYGEISLDEDTGEIVGEELVGDGDDPEYTLENGVTTFHVAYDEPVICVMTNAEYPNLILYTGYIDISGVSAIEDVRADGLTADSIVSVYNLQGMIVRENVRMADATEGLAPGVYMVGSRKVLVR